MSPDLNKKKGSQASEVLKDRKWISTFMSTFALPANHLDDAFALSASHKWQRFGSNRTIYPLPIRGTTDTETEVLLSKHPPSGQ